MNVPGFGRMGKRDWQNVLKGAGLLLGLLVAPKVSGYVMPHVLWLYGKLNGGK
jgi:hypothetical protein